MIADVRQCRTGCSLVNTRFVGLLMISIQPHSLPVMDDHRTIIEGIRCFRCNIRNRNTLSAGYTIFRGRNFLHIFGCFVICLMDKFVRNPVLEVNRRCGQRIIRCFVANDNGILHIADGNRGRTDGPTSESKRSLFAAGRGLLLVEIEILGTVTRRILGTI